jgi:hypothetical protein
LNSKEPIVSKLGVESLGPANPLTTNLSAPILLQVVPPKVTPFERQLVLQAAMEENGFTSSGSPHTPILAKTIGGIFPPKPPSPIWTTVVSNPSTSGSGLIPSSTVTTAPFTQSAMGPPFSYGMLIFDSNSIITYSTLQTMGLGTRSSNTLVQGSIGGTSVPFNSIPYGGGHIPYSSPSLGGSFQQPIKSNVNYSLFGEGILGPSSYTMSVGSMSFSLFGVFGNNVFSSIVVSAMGNPGFGKQNPVQATIPTQRESTGVFSSQGLWNPW